MSRKFEFNADEFNKDNLKGLQSDAAKAAFEDMRSDDVTLVWMDHLGVDMMMHVVLNESVLIN